MQVRQPASGSDYPRRVAALSLRRAEPRDAPAVMAWLDSDPESRAGTAEGWSEPFARSPIPVFVAERDDGAAGAIWLEPEDAGDTADVHIIVAPHERRGGIGLYLLRTVLTHADLAGVSELRLDVRVDNPAAHALVRSAGGELIAEGDPADPESHHGFVLRRTS